MKIDQPAPSAMPLTRLSKTGTPATSGSDAAERAKDSGQVSGQVHAMPGASSDFDAARVASIREDIRAGRYQIKPERIADGLLDSVRNLLDSKEQP